MTDRIDDPSTEFDTDETLMRGSSLADDEQMARRGVAIDVTGRRDPQHRDGDLDDDAGVPVGAVERDLDADRDAFEPTAAAALVDRIWRRVLRRPIAWANRPWPNERILRYVVTVVALGATTAIMMNVVHLNPLRPGQDLIFDDTTPTGGDFGAHVWGPAYLRDHLLGSFRFNGWTMDWYGGMPAYRFYMVLPAIAIVIADVVLPYGVAIKVVSVLGLLTLPAACWAFGRLAAFRYPMPELFAFAGLAFALDESFSIYGGNLKSTMAGEFSFSIALSLAVLALGVLAAGLRTGKYRVWASVLIAAACVSHGIVLIFVVGAALVFCLLWLDRTRLVYALTVGVTSLLLIMWWAGPFLLDHEYMTDMKYGSREDWWEMFFPLTQPLDMLITTLAVVGFVMSIVRRNLNGAALGVTGLVFAAGVYLAKDSLPLIGLLWNPRLLPFVYLVRYLLMMVGAVELMSLFWNAVRDRRALASPSVWESSTFAAITAIPVVLVLGFMFQVLPGGGYQAVEGAAARYSWGPFDATESNADAQGDGWARYNFLGYEGRGEFYTEYHQVVTTMQNIGADPSLGCGRATWENSADNGQYGTTMALMLLPFWSDGCIGSMEGLFFEASGTTPYHFLTTAAISKQSSNPVRELRYVDNDADVGVPHLQDLGVRYLMVRTDEAKAEAATHPGLSYITSSAPWDIYLVAGSDIVVPLDTQPVVVRDRPGDARERHLELGTSWFQQQDEWAAIPADDGPDAWQRIDVQVDASRRLLEGDPGGPRVDIVVPAEAIQAVALPPVTVSNVVIDQQSLEFDVDEVGVPVLVRVGYFPNWNATGADGPYRVGPNMMVVVPESTHVELSYGRSAIDYITVLLTLIGIGLCFVWRRQGDVRHLAEIPSAFARGGGNRAHEAAGEAGVGGRSAGARIDDWSLAPRPAGHDGAGHDGADHDGADHLADGHDVDGHDGDGLIADGHDWDGHDGDGPDVSGPNSSEPGHPSR